LKKKIYLLFISIIKLHKESQFSLFDVEGNYQTIILLNKKTREEFRHAVAFKLNLG
jgi:hypothetical protein